MKINRDKLKFYRFQQFKFKNISNNLIREKNNFPSYFSGFSTNAAASNHIIDHPAFIYVCFIHRLLTFHHKIQKLCDGFHRNGDDNYTFIIF